MATLTPKYELQKKEDNDFYNIEDLNANWDKVENALTEFDDSGTAEGIGSFTDMLTKLVTGNKLAVTLRNLKAGLQFVLHAGSIVNNCVTDNAKLPLSAAQGKVLQDAITKLNSDLAVTLENIQQPSSSAALTYTQWIVSALRCGNIATLSFNVSGTMAADTNFVPLLTIPENYRPKNDCYQSYSTQDGNPMTILIRQNGKAEVFNNNKTVSGFLLRQTLSFPVS